jgi:hypothetical protein
MAVDAGPWPPRRPLAYLRLRRNARGRDGSVCQELAAGIARRRNKKRKFMWSRPPRITGHSEASAELVLGARRKGRPPLGSQAMSGAERARRYRHRLAELGKPSKASER